MTDNFLERHHELHAHHAWRDHALLVLGAVLFVLALFVAWRLGPA